MWKTRFGTIGVGICWDQWFPECARAMTLLDAEIPLHNHAMRAEAQIDGNKGAPSSSTTFARSKGGTLYQGTNNVTMTANVVAPAGSGQPHNNLMPYLTLNFCIALLGINPPHG